MSRSVAQGSASASQPPGPRTAGLIIARQDRLTSWAMSPFMLVVIGAGFLFTFYDIFDINVSFIQTCVQIVPGCDPESAAQSIGLPTLVNLVGYVIGALGLSVIADRFGRRNTMLLTLAITGLGSLYSALSGDYANFTFSRFVTGIGIGADLAVVNTYIGEMSPRSGRARYTSLIFVNSALGAFVGIWLGLILTTPPTPFPLGLPFAAAGPSFENGWRMMYFVAAVLSVVGILLRWRLPESPRWLVTNDRLEEADLIVGSMEARASRHQTLAPVAAEVVVHKEGRASYAEIFGNPLYLKRMLLLTVMWMIAYVTVYSIAAGLTSVLASVGYPPPEAGLIAAVGTLGFIACAIFAYYFGEKLERKYWLPVMAVVTLIGGILLAVAGRPVEGQMPWGAFLGSIILFFGFNGWVPITYAWSAENFPTRARVTGFGIVDGVGHIGGGLGLVLIAPLLPALGALFSMLLISGFLVVAAVIAQFGINTRGRHLDDVSP